MLLTPRLIKEAEEKEATSLPSPPSSFKPMKLPKTNTGAQIPESFAANSSAAAQTSSSNIFSSGSQKTMPVVGTSNAT